MTIARSGHAGAVVGNEVYLIGGMVNNGTIVTFVEIYCSKNDTFLPAPSLPSPLFTHSCAYYSTNNYIYCVGGSYNNVPLSALWIFNIGSNSWSSGPSMNVGRCRLGLGLYGTKLYAIGGNNGTVLASAESIDLTLPTTIPASTSITTSTTSSANTSASTTTNPSTKKASNGSILIASPLLLFVVSWLISFYVY